MNGFMRRLSRSWLFAASMGLTLGCQTLPLQHSHTSDCEGGKCKKHGFFSEKFAKLRRQIRDFDDEQLHPDHCWPEQYSREAMRRVNAPLGQQVANGNNVENTVWEHYFETDESGRKTAKLSESGKRRLQYFARRKPYIIPTLSLQSSYDRDLDAKRIESVMGTIKDYSLEPVAWHVSITDRVPNGLYGPEGPKAITKMIGPGAGPPAYEENIKEGFLSSGSGSTSGSGSGS